MSLATFTLGVLVLLFGYNFVIIEWQRWQERRRQRRLDEHRNRYL